MHLNYICKFYNIIQLGMHDIIRMVSESAENGFKCKYHRPDVKNDADMSCR